MLWTFIIVSICLTYVTGQKGDDDIKSVLKNIEKRLDEKDVQISKLEKIVRAQEDAMKEQEETIDQLKEEVTSQKATIQKLQDDPDNVHEPDSDTTTQIDNNMIKKRSSMRGNRRSLNRIRRAENETPVAFLAQLTAHAEHLGADQTIEFDAVTTNIGQAYNSHVGVFTAPVSGIYVFSTTIMSYVSTNSHYVFKRNGTPITYLFYHGAALGGYDTTSNTIVLALSAGDDVTVANVDSDKNVHGSRYSSFSGFLLQELYDETAVVGK